MRGVSDGTFINREKQYDEKENGEEYEKVCEQRRLERKIRADKTKQNALKAAGDDEGAQSLNAKINAENKQLRAYCDKEGLIYQQDRTQVYGFRDVKRKAVNDDFVQTIDKSAGSGIINMSKSVKIPDDCPHLLKAETNFSNKNISVDILRTIDSSIEKQLSKKSDFAFDEIKIAKFAKGDKSVFITNYEHGISDKTQLYLNSDFFINSSLEDINNLCESQYRSGWWKSKSMNDLINHEIMHAKINNYNSFEKAERLYQTLSEDNRVMGFCRLVDKDRSEFMNEMYVAVQNGEEIEKKYIDVYNEYAKEFLGGK